MRCCKLLLHIGIMSAFLTLLAGCGSGANSASDATATQGAGASAESSTSETSGEPLGSG